MSSWAYGFVEFDKELQFGEVYFNNKNKPYMFFPLDLDNIIELSKKEREFIAEDISSQIRTMG